LLPSFKIIQDLVKAFPDEEACLLHLETLRWNGTPVSPFDPTSKVYKCAGHRYKCKSTNKYFNVKVGTIFEDTKIPLQKWFMALYIFSSHKKGISSHQLAKDIDVTQKSAWFMLHRLRYAFAHPNFQATMEGTVEIGETYMGGKESNKQQNKKPPNTQGSSFKTEKAAVGVLQREWHVIGQVVEDVTSSTLVTTIMGTVEPSAVVHTDKHQAYRPIAKVYNHHIIRHSAKQYIDGQARTNSLEGFWSHFKSMVYSIYHHVSFEHLQAYIMEFSLRWNTCRSATSDSFNFILSNVAGRLTYQTLIAHA
jgi:transposase-like protein